ncbi:hypothetical protein J0910_18690 [Nocardiopsis sp. CNT-189]|uniref:PaaX family transcriptional regulator n=1 Tax=Nocardiopsis oceanisediminis TaxID=2816862 RepID=UPI003B2E7BF9
MTTAPGTALDGPNGTPGETPDTAGRSGGERRNRRPRSLIVSFFGGYGREIGGWVSVAGLISLMAGLEVDAPGVRSAVSRLKRRGLLEAERRGGAAGYRLSEAGVRILADGDRRIFERRTAELSAGWVLVVFSIPEAERGLRHRLRSRLTWLGFGSTAAGVWIAPAHLADEARRALTELGARGYAQLFTGQRLGFGDLADAVADWWDLDALQGMYRAFLGEYEPVLARHRLSGEDSGDPAAAFADHLRAVDAWRRMPFLDPGLPPEVLPSAWSGTRAAQVFLDLHALLRPPALEHVRTATGG